MASDLTSDWTDEDVANYIIFCGAVGISDLSVPITCWSNESDNRTTAHNPNGHASGLCQLMPSTAAGLGWDTKADPQLDAYRALSVSGQLQWCTKYYRSYRGQIGTLGAFYTSTFLPALLSHASDPSYVLCGQRGPFAWAYSANRGFDATLKGTITVQDLANAANRQFSARSQQLVDRVMGSKAGVCTT